MKDQSQMYEQLNLWDTPNAISSPEYPAGRLPCNSPDGRKIDQSGLEVAPASHSVQPESEKGSATSATSGRSFSASSKRGSRKSFSASKSHPQKLSALSLRLISLTRFGKGILLEQIGLPTNSAEAPLCTTITGGSIEYEQTWTPRVTPCGARYWEHTASERRTGDIDCIGEVFAWPTATVNDSSGSQYQRCPGGTIALKLPGAAAVAAWNTPRATDGRSVAAGCAVGGVVNSIGERQQERRDTITVAAEVVDDLRGIQGLPPWQRSAFIYCRDNKIRRVPAESVLLGVADGVSEGVDGIRVEGICETGGFPLTTQKEGRSMLLKGYGNAIVPQVAAEFVKAFMAEME